MPRKTTTNTHQEKLSNRISELTDRVAVLEHNLKTTQERVQRDVNIIIEQMKKR